MKGFTPIKKLAFVASVAALGLIAPAGALAASTSTASEVTSTAGAELSLVVATPAAMTLTHAVTPTATSAVTVTSTSPSWTLSVSDQDASGSLTPGKMDRVNCITSALLGGSLASALQWSVDGTTFNSLSGTPATVATGSLVDAKTVTYRQALGATEGITVGDCYRLTATYTVTDV
jgi:hypothetical protein